MLNKQTNKKLNQGQFEEAGKQQAYAVPASCRGPWLQKIFKGLFDKPSPRVDLNGLGLIERKSVQVFLSKSTCIERERIYLRQAFRALDCGAPCHNAMDMIVLLLMYSSVSSMQTCGQKSPYLKPSKGPYRICHS